MSGPVSSVALAVGLCAAALSAQRTWIVDPESRPGFDFADLPPAIAASAPGDTIRVRSSATGVISFQSMTSKGITILGEGAHLFSGTLTLQALPADQRFVLRDFGPMSFASSWYVQRDVRIVIVACQGTVHLQNVRCSPFQFQVFMPFTRAQIAIQNSRQVTLRQCTTVWPGGGLSVLGSTVLAVDSDFVGNTTQYISQFQLDHWAYPSAVVVGSEVVAVDSRFHGGAGSYGYLCTNLVSNVHGVSLSSSRLVLVGAASTVTGGRTQNSSVCCCFSPQPSVIGTGTVVADPAAVLDPPPTIVVTRRAEPTTRSSNAVFGGTLRVAVSAHAGALAATFVSLPGPVTSMPFGTLWLDPATMSLLDLATLDLSGNRSVEFQSITIPDGVPLTFQTAVLVANNLSVTVPGITVIGQ